jgi:signal recognition particle receptor subunit beta
VQINLGARKIHCKIVYYGPGCSGKTTNIQKVHERMPRERKSDLTSIATEGDRTLFFDFMSLDLGQVNGMDTCFQLYTVPGQVYYNATRKLVLQGVDGLVFVADSSPDRLQANVECWQDLIENLAEYRLTLDDIPVVIQFNKRDVPGAVPTENLNALINQKGFKTFDSVASKGEGVLETLKAVCSSVIARLSLKAGPERSQARTAPVSQVRETQVAATAGTTMVASVAGVPSASSAGTATIAAEEMTATTVSAPPVQGISKVSLDYSVQPKPSPAIKPAQNTDPKPRSTASLPDRNTTRKQPVASRSTSVVRPTGSMVVVGRIEPRRRGSRIVWLFTLGGLAAAAVIAAVMNYLMHG